MSNQAKKTEHCGAKHGDGSYYGLKEDAKHESNKRRRLNNKKETEAQIDEYESSACHPGCPGCSNKRRRLRVK